MLITVGYHPDETHVADIHSIEPHWSSCAQTAGVVYVGFQFQFLGEDTAAATHQEDKHSQCGEGNHDRDPDFQLRPLQLLLARHALSPAPCSQGSPCRIVKCGKFPCIIADKMAEALRQTVRGLTVLVSASASKYATAPQARVTLSPN